MDLDRIVDNFIKKMEESKLERKFEIVNRLGGKLNEIKRI